ncbi:MAG: PAS domain S-box protein [Acidobacteriota bacterium]|nr:PAS domain S-box protein [Acidobacteriota bacterium]
MDAVGAMSMCRPVGKIIVVDDEPELRTLLVQSLIKEGYEATGYSSGLPALAKLKEQNFDVLLTDLMMPEMDGISLLGSALEIDPHLVGIIMTGQGTIQTAVDAMKLGAFDYVLKPFRMQTLMPALTRAMNTRHLRLENLQLRDTVAIHGLSQTIAFTLDPQTVLSKLADAALQQTDADEVSILLPTSDGRELYVAAVRGEKRERLLGERIPFAQSIASWVAREGEPVILNGAVHDNRFVALWPRPEISSAISVPMQVANKLVGVINLNLTSRLRPFARGQMKALTILASTAASALETASLYRQVHNAEERYRSIFENAVEGIFQATADRRFTTVNPSMVRILGYDSPEEVIATITDIRRQLYVNPEVQEEFTRTLHKGGVVQGAQFEAYRKDGQKIWLSLNMRLISDETGGEICCEGAVEDITERKKAEDELIKSEERYRDLVENAHDIIYEHDLSGNYTSTNKAAQQITGYSREEGLGMSLAKTLAPEYVEKALEMLRRKLAGESITAYDLEIIAKDGSRIAVEVNTRLVLKDGVPVGVQGIARDITKRKRAEDALRNSEARKRAILESAMDCIITMDHQGMVVDWNPASEKTFGFSQEEATGRELAELIIPPRFRVQHRQGLARYLATGKARNLGQRQELSAQRRDGAEFPVELTITRIEFEGTPMFTGYLRDITERKSAEDRLVAQYAITRAIAESNTFSEGAQEILQAVCKSLGWEHGGLWTLADGPDLMRCTEIWQAPGAEADEFAQATRESVFAMGIGLPGRVWTNCQPVWISDVVEDANFSRLSIAAKVGFRVACGFPIWLRSEVLGVVEFFSRSIREPDPALLAMMATIGGQIGQFIESKRVEEALGESEEQLRQSQKLEAIGQLAGGVAHDFNNLLTVIGGYSSIILGKLSPESPHRSSVEEIKKASDRAGSLTRQLLAFSRKQILQPKILDLNSVVSDLEKMVRRLIGEDIDLLALTDPNLGQVEADPGQIEQVLLNLIVNARDAMPAGGKLTIETGNTVLSSDYALRHAALAGPYVMLAVTDTGCGMAADLQAHVFEPFFTTKGSGKGTGLGLATVYGIVKQSGGNVWLYSEVGKGSTFKIYLPRVDAVTADEQISAGVPLLPKGTETVLLVEDEEQVRKIVQAILEGQGYDVLAAANGEEALEIAAQHDSEIHLMITDVVMPQMSGPELADRLATIRPHSRVLYMSGYTDDAIVRHGLLDAKLNFIHKPFDAATAARKVRDVLDS